MPTSQFKRVRQSTLPSLGAKTSSFRHPSGAEHFHLHLEGDENAFLVAFRTPPSDSTGIAHILEHTTLCGSKRFPVRDPFFLMLRRSLNTFMNAMTSSDWTAYPFATRCEADYWNLLEVYLDATFFPLLRPLDFAQEGHRLELEDVTNIASDLVVRGVVFNEMKGAMSSSSDQLWHGMSRHLCAGTPYQHNSGGDPEEIPQLRHEQLLQFHRDCYRPANAIFITAGPLPPESTQARIEQLVMAQIEQQDTRPPLAIPLAKRWQRQRNKQASYPVGEDASDHHQSVISWLLPNARQPLARLQNDLMNYLLLGNAASPLRQKLESSGIGHGLSLISGLEDSQRESIFTCGLKDVAAKDLPQVPSLIHKCLEEISRKGVEKEHLEAAMQKLEFSCRQITGDAMPFPLELMFEALPALIYGDDPDPFLDPGDYLRQLETQSSEDGFVGELVRTRLLENPHCLHYEMKADPELAGRQQQAHKEMLQAKRAAMAEDELEQLRADQQQLAEHQASTDDVTLLPKVSPDQMSADLQLPVPEERDGISLYNAPTNGISYLELCLPLPDLNEAECALLPLYCACLSGLGVGGDDYAQTQAQRARFLGSMRASFHCQTTASSNSEIVWISLNTSALNRHRSPLMELPLAALAELRLDEYQRIGEIRNQMIAGRESAIAGNGHLLAMQAAAAGLSPQAAFAHCSSGLAGLKYLTQTLAAQPIEQLADALKSLHAKVQDAGWRTALVTGKEHANRLHKQAEASGAVTQMGNWAGTQLQLPTAEKRVGWLWQLAVNYCALALPAPSYEHQDAPGLTVLGSLLRSHWLHTHIREQGGAYGSGATHHPTRNTFTLFSYRDPRLSETFADLHRALAASADIVTPEAVTEAILNQAGGMDKKGSPAGEALSAFHRLLVGKTDAQLYDWRQRLLAADVKSVTGAAHSWLTEAKAEHAAVLADSSRLAEIEGLKMTPNYMPQMK